MAVPQPVEPVDRFDRHTVLNGPFVKEVVYPDLTSHPLPEFARRSLSPHALYIQKPSTTQMGHSPMEGRFHSIFAAGSGVANAFLMPLVCLLWQSQSVALRVLQSCLLS
jgi:hypothetical protein